MSLAEPWELPDGWSWSTIGEVADADSGEWGDEPGTLEVDVPVVRSTETRGLVVELDAADVRSLTFASLTKTELRSGDILVVKSSGSAHLVGRPSFVMNTNGQRYGFSNFMLRLRAKEGISAELLFGFLSSSAGRALMLRLNRTTSGLRNLIQDRYLRVPVPLPSGDVESELLARLRRIDEALEAANATRERLDALRRSTLLGAYQAPRADIA